MIHLVVSEKCLQRCKWCQSQRHATKDRRKRELTKRSLMKIINMFPDEKEYTITGGEPMDSVRQTCKLVNKLHIEGKIAWVETSMKSHWGNIEQVLKCEPNICVGWAGIHTDVIGDLHPLTYLERAMTTYPHLKYKCRLLVCNWSGERVIVAIGLLAKLQQRFPQLECEMDYERPKRAKYTMQQVYEGLRYAKKIGFNIPLKPRCNEITVAPNTIIYRCPIIYRRPDWAEEYKHTDRDKNAIGSLRRGFFEGRCIDSCLYCRGVNDYKPATLLPSGEGCNI